ncbi:MAG: protein kinase domain-containing protein [Myxococcota bacterium]
MSDLELLSAHGFSDATFVAQGGAARVYRATSAGRAVAVKVVDAPLTARLAQEASLLALVGPPAVPRVEARHARLLVLEWLDGETVAAWLRRAPVPAERLRVARAVCRALAAVHAAGVVHRDVKSSNVMVDGGGARWFDFGLAQRGVTHEPARQGTPTTMAPESWEGGELGFRADVYGLGVLLFEVLTGRPPFTGDAVALEHAHRHLRPPAAGLGALDALLARCLEKRPERRPADAAEVLAALEGPESVASAPAPGARPRGDALQPLALVGVRSPAPLPALSRGFGVEGAWWAGSAAGVHLFARPHPEGPAAGLRHLRVAVEHLAIDEATFHVAPCRVRVGSVSVRVSGEALEDLRWLSPGRRHFTPAAEAYRAEASGDDAALAVPFLDDGSRLAPVLDALRGEGPVVVWVELRSGAGRTRLLEELARQVAALPGAGEVWLVDDAEQLGWQAWEWLEARSTPGASERVDVVVVGDATVRRLRPKLGERAARFVHVTPRLLSDAECEQVVRVLLSPAELVPHALVRRLASATEGHVGELVDSLRLLRRRGLLAQDRATGEWRLSSEVLSLAPRARLEEALAEVPLALHDVAKLLAVASWEPTANEAAAALLHAPSTSRLDAEAALARLETLGLLEQVDGRLRWRQRGVRRALAATSEGRLDFHRALASVFPTGGLAELRARLLEAAIPLAHRPRARVDDAGRLLPASTRTALRALAHHAHLARPAAPSASLKAGASGEAARSLPNSEAGARSAAPSASFASPGVSGDAQADDAGRSLPGSEAGARSAAPSVLPTAGPSGAQADEVGRSLPGSEAGARSAAPSVSGDAQADDAGRSLPGSEAGARSAAPSVMPTAGPSGDAPAEDAGRPLPGLAPRVSFAAVEPPDVSEVADEALAAAGLAALVTGDALEADRLLSLVLARRGAPTLLLARARARRQLERFGEALADARAAAEDPSVAVAALLEASLSLDWMNEFAEGNALTEQALQRAEAAGVSPDTPLGHALALARGRLAVRTGRWDDAVAALAPLERVDPSPAEVETVLGAHALLGSVACVQGDFARAEALFAAGLAHASRWEQPVAACALWINRPMLWMALGRLDDALADFQRAAETSRRLGHAQIERVASHNLAQYLVWQGRLDEAEVLARRAAELARLRLGAVPPADALLLARLAVSRADEPGARAALGQAGEGPFNPSELLQRGVVRAWLGEVPWAEVLEPRDGVVPDELLDAARLAARHATQPEVRALAEAAVARLEGTLGADPAL